MTDSSAVLLGSARLVAFIPVTNLAAARSFYESTLGLAVIEETPFALIVDANGTPVRITPVPDLRPQPFTVAGFEVRDIEATVNVLAARGVSFNRYENMVQRPDGIWESPSGDLVTWFTDPDGNTLSLTEYTTR